MQAKFRECLNDLMNMEDGYIVLDDDQHYNYIITYNDGIFTINAHTEEDDYVSDLDYDSLIDEVKGVRILNLTLRGPLGGWIKRFYHRDYPDEKQMNIDYDYNLTEDIDVCPICLDQLIVGVCKSTNCNHLFHCKCIEKWPKNNCPVCRAPLEITKIADINDYAKIAGINLFGNKNINSEIKYLLKLQNE